MGASQHVENTIPVLPVSDLKRDIQFYTETLGFDLDWETAGICSVSRDGCAIMLDQRPRSDSGSWMWIGPQDDTPFEVYRSRGVKVRQEPENSPGHTNASSRAWTATYSGWALAPKKICRSRGIDLL